MFGKLLPHPSTPAAPSSAVDSISAHIHRADGGLAITFEVHADLSRLVIPETASPERRDNLWRTTCLEAFATAPDAPAYFEWNLAPSGDWAAYRFDSYRENGTNADSSALIIQTSTKSGALILTTRLLLPPELTKPPTLHIGLSAVIEQTDGLKTYWALAHPSEQPDFHHRESFVLEVSAQS